MCVTCVVFVFVSCVYSTFNSEMFSKGEQSQVCWDENLRHCCSLRNISIFYIQFRNVLQGRAVTSLLGWKSQTLQFTAKHLNILHSIPKCFPRERSHKFVGMEISDTAVHCEIFQYFAFNSEMLCGRAYNSIITGTLTDSGAKQSN